MCGYFTCAGLPAAPIQDVENRLDAVLDTASLSALFLTLLQTLSAFLTHLLGQA